MEFPRPGYRNGLPSPPSLGALPDPGIELASPALASGFFTTGATREASISGTWLLYYLVQPGSPVTPLLKTLQWLLYQPAEQASSLASHVPVTLIDTQTPLRPPLTKETPDP